MSDPEPTVIDPSRWALPDRHPQFELEDDRIESDDPPARRPLASATGSAERPTTRAAVPISSAASQLATGPGRLAAVTSCPTEAWAGRLSRLVSLEIQMAVPNGVLTAAEAEQLLARLMIVIDQAITTPRS